MHLADYANAPQKPGCYVLSLHGIPKYIGVATDMTGTVKGLRRRLWQHHNGNASHPKIQKHKNVLTVSCKVTTSGIEARQLESELIKRFNTLEPDGWNRRMPRIFGFLESLLRS